MKHVYQSEKDAQKDIRVVLGYSAASMLSAEDKRVLEEARNRLEMLSGRDLLAVLLTFRRTGLTPQTPPWRTRPD